LTARPPFSFKAALAFAGIKHKLRQRAIRESHLISGLDFTSRVINKAPFL
jgi:hypothetical protein